MENKEKADQTREQDLLTAPLPVFEDSESLNEFLTSLDPDTEDQKSVSDDEDQEKTEALSTQDLHDLSNLLIEGNSESEASEQDTEDEAINPNPETSETNNAPDETKADENGDLNDKETITESTGIFAKADSSPAETPETDNSEQKTGNENKINSSAQPINLFNYDTNGTEFYSNSSVIENIKQERKRPSKALLWFLFGFVVVALLGLYSWGIYYYKNNFLPNTYISGYNMSNKSLDEALEILDNASQDRKVTIKGIDGEQSEVLASEVGLVLKESPDIEETLNNQNVYAWPKYLLINNGTFIESGHQLDETKLNEVVDALSVVSGEQVVKTQNAGVRYNGREYVIKDEVYGTEVNVPLLRQAVLDALVEGDDVISLQEDDLYVKPVTLSDSTTLSDSVKTLNKALDTVVTYDFQTSQETLNKDTFSAWMSTDDQGAVKFDSEQLNGYIKGLADKYDTYGKPVVFTTTGGEARQYTELYSGWEIDQPGEAEALQAVILAGNSVTREPVYASTGKDRSQGNTISGTYLEISIPSQTMWYYKDGELIVSTPVVTGDEYNGYGTSKGYFVLQNKETNVVLRGDNADGSQYASPVTFWLPFHNGDGVHDASWRSAYGGRIYLGNGSHGCVNTPYSAVKTIFNNISVGDPVIVY